MPMRGVLLRFGRVTCRANLRCGTFSARSRNLPGNSNCLVKFCRLDISCRRRAPLSGLTQEFPTNCKTATWRALDAAQVPESIVSCQPLAFSFQPFSRSAFSKKRKADNLRPVRSYRTLISRTLSSTSERPCQREMRGSRRRETRAPERESEGQSSPFPKAMARRTTPFWRT